MTALAPARFGSYAPDDVSFLLTDLTGRIEEAPVEEREAWRREGRHYSESLPQEYRPTAAYLELFEALLADGARETAHLTATLAELILARKPAPVLVSLARAGTPVGVLLRRCLRVRHGVDAPHYSISIIRDRGIDEVAVRYILDRHAKDDVVFVDGWTGKGVIQRELSAAAEPLGLDDELAVLADPGWVTTLTATREDVLVPSACLNATVSGLVSRTVLNDELIAPGEFHGAKWYPELRAEDVSNRFVDTVAAHFGDPSLAAEVATQRAHAEALPPPDWRGWAEVQAVRDEYGLPHVNLVKPGVGETTRVLLRRVPWKVLVNPAATERLTHVIRLANDRGIELVERPDTAYSAIGLIEP